MMRFVSMAAGAAIALGLSAVAAAADDCTAARLRATATYQKKSMICYAIAAKKGDAFDVGGCLDKANAVFTAAAGAAGSCPGQVEVCDAVTGDCLAAVTDAVDAVEPDKCVARKRKAAGKFAAALLKCSSISAARGAPVDAACVSKAETKFAALLAKAGACDDGGSLADLIADRCVSPVVALDVSLTVTGACIDVDECTQGADNCSADAACTNTPGGFSCACNAGYAGDGVACTDVDECAGGSDNCSASAVCTNTPGGFSCACNSGYTGDGVVCTDVDECAGGSDNCSADASCTNTPGGFSCACNPGFAGDGVTCGPLLSCPCWNTYSAESMAALLNSYAGLPDKDCILGPTALDSSIEARTVPFSSSSSAAIQTYDISGLTACCNYIGGSPEEGCVTTSAVVVAACRAEVEALMPSISWCAP